MVREKEFVAFEKIKFKRRDQRGSCNIGTEPMERRTQLDGNSSVAGVILNMWNVKPSLGGAWDNGDVRKNRFIKEDSIRRTECKKNISRRHSD